MKKSNLQATTVRNILLGILLLTIAAAGAGFYYGLEQVRAYAVEVSHTTADANAGDKNIENLRKLKQTLTDSESLVAKANKVFATKDNYQSQAVTDVQRYAKFAGVAIAQTKFSDDKNSLATDLPMTIRLESPTEYSKLLKFLNAVEGNVPKMQITGISLSRPTPAQGDRVDVDEITITISTR